MYVNLAEQSQEYWIIFDQITNKLMSGGGWEKFLFKNISTEYKKKQKRDGELTF